MVIDGFIELVIRYFSSGNRVYSWVYTSEKNEIIRIFYSYIDFFVTIAESIECHSLNWAEDYQYHAWKGRFFFFFQNLFWVEADGSLGFVLPVNPKMQVPGLIHLVMPPFFPGKQVKGGFRWSDTQSLFWCRSERKTHWYDMFGKLGSSVLRNFWDVMVELELESGCWHIWDWIWIYPSWNPLKILPLEAKVSDSTEELLMFSAYSKSGYIHLKCLVGQAADDFFQLVVNQDRLIWNSSENKCRWFFCLE